MQLVFTDIGPISTFAFAADVGGGRNGTGTIRAALAASCSVGIVSGQSGDRLVLHDGLSATACCSPRRLATIHLPLRAVGVPLGVCFMAEIRRCKQFLLGYALSWIPLGRLVMSLLISTLVAIRV